MKICLLAEPATSPVLTAALHRLSRRHTIVHRDPVTLAGTAFAHRPSDLGDIDVYLLKSRSSAARTFAVAAEQAGATVINSPASTAAALDRATMAGLLQGAGIPTPQTWTAGSLRALAHRAQADTARAGLRWPLVVKSRISRRGDLVTRVDDLADLLALLPQWSDEPVIAQEFIPNDGYDLKFWVVDEQVTLARRPGALESRRTDRDVALNPDQLPAAWVSVVLDAGAALGLEIFGADALITDDGPVIIDVNAFPGFRCAAGADIALSDLVERRGADRRLCA